jgi:carboxyl-terminal processing protease
MNTLPQSRAFKIVLCIIILIGVFAVGVYAGFNRAPELSHAQTILNKEEGKPGDVDFALFWKVWNELEDKYVSPTDNAELPTAQERVYAAIEGLASAYGDPYTVFFPPEESKAFEEEISGEFQGIGAEIGKKEGILTVVAPIKNTPAYRAGLQPGDQIISIDDKSTGDLTVDEAIKLIRGKKGTVVVLTIIRDGKEPQKISITRDTIEIPTVETKKIADKGIFVISLYNFSEQSSARFRTALGEFVSSGYSKLIVDLRGNPGGYLIEANRIASWFLPKGQVVVSEYAGEDKPREVYTSEGYDLFSKNLKMVILVNEGSASASEILAGALSEYKVATLVGTKTFGKGTVQELIKVSPLTSLKVTIARWLTPNGKNIAEGIVPDHVVELTEEDAKAGKDPQLDKAIELLSK